MTGVADPPRTASDDAACRVNLGPGSLIFFHIIYVFVCCVSLVATAQFYAPLLRIVPTDQYHLALAATHVAPFALLSILFVVCRFSFGYALSFYFYTVILGYLWLTGFSQFKYDHALAYASAIASGLALFLPALFIASPVKQRFVMSRDAFDRLLFFILILASVVLAIGASFNVRLVGISDVADVRNRLAFPVWLQYAMDATSTVLLPFAFACFAMLGKPWRAGLSLLLLLLFYPVTLSKSTLLAPAWLPLLALASRYFSTRATTILSLLVPILLGVFLKGLFDAGVLSYAKFMTYFGLVNFRMVALASGAIDVYNDFFASHQLTHFCQITFMKWFIDCPYPQSLALTLQNYGLGNINASLLATEGIASVGPMLAPLSVSACGLVIALGNRLSSGLPPRVILISSGVLVQAFINVPFTITMVTFGGAILFLLWYVTPRDVFESPAETAGAETKHLTLPPESVRK